MALSATGFFANFTLTDSGGNDSTLRYKLTSADIATAVTDAGTIVTALNAITDAVITGYTVGQAYEEDSAFLAAEGVQIENVASISARIDAAEEKWATLRIPAPNIGIFQAATGSKSNVVDPADAALVTYLNLFVETTGICTLSDGENLLSPGTAGNVDGKRIHRASRKG
jgi:hypothetical protein